METDSNGVPLYYYRAPHSLQQMNTETYNGLLAIGTMASLSMILTSTLLIFITWRMFAWKSYYTTFVGRNQCVVLIYQLILADFIQSLGFIISFHWTSERRIIGPDGACFAQGWLVQMGDVASAFFVLAIALHTSSQVVLRKALSHRTFLLAILGIWLISLLLTIMAPIVGGRYVFQLAGSWVSVALPRHFRYLAANISTKCWISAEHADLRVSIHYVWIFIVQFGSILIYAYSFYHLLYVKQTNSLVTQGPSNKAFRKASAAMLAYALVYTLLTVPLA
jgi:hypothetical protein